MRIFGRAVTAPADASAAGWIGSRLGEFGSVGGLVPDGFDACVLIRPVQFVDGRMDDHERTATIADVGRRHTATPDVAWFAIWEGYGWATSRTYSIGRRGSAVAALVHRWHRELARIHDHRRRRRIRRGLAQVSRFDLPHRRYLLVRGPVDAAASICEPGGTRLQVADLWWPDDRAWFVAGDTDLDWTYLAGTRAFVADLTTAFPGRIEPVRRDSRNADHG